MGRLAMQKQPLCSQTVLALSGIYPETIRNFRYGSTKDIEDLLDLTTHKDVERHKAGKISVKEVELYNWIND